MKNIKRVYKAILGVYVIATLPLTLLLLQSNHYQKVTVSEISRKIAHVRAPEYALVGDSITAGFISARSLLDCPPFSILNQGVSGCLIADCKSQLENIARLKPRRVSILAGTNDVLRGRTDAQILADMSDLISRVKSLGFSSVSVTGIPLKRSPPDDGRVIQLDLEIKRLAESAGFQFVDLNIDVLAAHNRNEFFVDEIHFSDLMYKIWAARLLAAK